MKHTMKIITKFIFLLLSFLGSYALSGQGGTASINPIDLNDVQINQSNGINFNEEFRINLSYSAWVLGEKYTVIMQLPNSSDNEGVINWDSPNEQGGISLGSNDQLFKDVEVNDLGANSYSIEFTIDQLTSQADFSIVGLRNRSNQSCSGAKDVDVEFEIKRNNSIEVSESVPVTINSKSDNFFQIYVGHGQEKSGPSCISQELGEASASAAMPYFVDVKYRASGNSFVEIPQLLLDFPQQKLEIISASLFAKNSFSSFTPNYSGQHYLNQPNFHGIEKLEETQDYIFTTSGLEFISGTNKQKYLNFDGNFVRIYFKVKTGVDKILSSEIVGRSQGGNPERCSYPETNPSGTELLVDESITQFFGNFEGREPSLFTDCADLCSTTSSNSSTFYFEANFSYLDASEIPVTMPAIKVSIPNGGEGVILNSLRLEGNGSSSATKVSYELNGETEVVEFSGETSVTFGAVSGVSEIVIENYSVQESLNNNLDISLGFEIDDVANFPSGNNFRLQYLNYSNEKCYAYRLNTGSNSCNTQFDLVERYANEDGSSFLNEVLYNPGKITFIRLQINPENFRVERNQKLSFTYKLDEDMMYPSSGVNARFSANSIDFSKSVNTLNSSQNNLRVYKNISVELDPNDASELIITADYMPEQFGNCIREDLFLRLSVQVKDNATVSDPDKRSTIQTSFDVDPGSWNVRRADGDNGIATTRLICPGNLQFQSSFAPGDLVSVAYQLSSLNQNPFRQFLASFPKPSDLEYLDGDLRSLIEIRTTSESGVQESNNFTILNPTANGFQLRLNNFTLNGKETITFLVPYRVKLDAEIDQDGSLGEDVTFNVDEYLGLDGPRFNSVPSGDGISTLKIVSTSQCDPPPPCDDCVTSFSPTPGSEYLLGAWIKVEFAEGLSFNPGDYEGMGAGVQISYNDAQLVTEDLFEPSGPVVDGWQRVEQLFTVPQNAYNISIDLVNNTNTNVYFDDVRIHPLRSNMKSYVYDPGTQRLTSELDENNYATFYEYDDEGNLIRVKKETERGVMTIQETRINQSKINDQ